MIIKKKKEKLIIGKEELSIKKNFNLNDDSKYSTSKGKMVIKQRRDVIEVKSYDYLHSCCMQVSKCEYGIIDDKFYIGLCKRKISHETYF